MGHGSDPASIRLDGGHLALDFVNTVGGLRDGPPDRDSEAFTSYENLLVWCRRVGVLSSRQASSLKRAAGEREAEARRALSKALALRDLCYAIFRALAEGHRPRRALLDRLRDADRKALAHARLVAADGALRWSFAEAGELSAPLWPLAHAAVELLTQGPLGRLRVCANCRWLFLDRSRNRSRRWCSMDGCGADIKKERFVERRRRRLAARRG